MKTYDIIRDILCDKTGQLHREHGFEAEFSPYMVARWLSMSQAKGVLDLADWVNKYGTLLPKAAVYQFLVRRAPRLKRMNIEYFKRWKAPEPNEDDIVVPEVAVIQNVG